jgi:hypothetical protein
MNGASITNKQGNICDIHTKTECRKQIPNIVPHVCNYITSFWALKYPSNEAIEKQK